MNRTRTTALAFSLLAYCVAAGAVESASARVRRDAPKGITEAFYACIDKADSNSIAIAACMSTEQGVQDARLNRTYQALLGKLDSQGQKQLVDAERAWLAFRHKASGLETTLYGSEIIANLEVSQRDIFRLCERANTFDDYLSLVNDQ